MLNTHNRYIRKLVSTATFAFVGELPSHHSLGSPTGAKVNEQIVEILIQSSIKNFQPGTIVQYRTKS
jgi:hypothetical protein